MNKSQKRILSILFHLVVLVGMVMAYDASRLLIEMLSSLKTEKKVAASVPVDLMAAEPPLSTEIDPELAKLVTKNGDELVFRRDLPFPTNLKVTDTNVMKFNNVRIAGKSDAGSGSVKISLREDEVMEYEMAGGIVRITMKEKASEKVPTAAEKMQRLKRAEEAIKNKKAPPDMRERKVDDLVGNTVQLKYDGKDWKTIGTKDFKVLAWGKGLEKEVGRRLVASSLMPRPRWFGTSPMKPGMVTKISGNSLDLVFDDCTGGSVEMVLRGMEGVHGHPCAVFEISGSLVEAKKENEHGQSTSGEVTIEKGRVWCSLLYPIVLRSEIDSIFSMKVTDGGKLVSQMQGPASEEIHRNWKAVKEKP